MFRLEEFRAGSYKIPFSWTDELPPCCFQCVYLLSDESPVCFCDAPFYYFCAYTWADNANNPPPPCLTAPGQDEKS